ncbi:hypothetical protein HMPREF9080_01313 [Cardiobacterium valvarum F0432]|uniref:Uncharacterized protein n=1 Tax=Cardiobacterium valvarum F0432 TaxID=797473 RepID=G9ZEX3_9GAMM|nr:hypothetical protein HMPREF9080_01313 [Cardiobacterium valvarum F0432]
MGQAPSYLNPAFIPLGGSSIYAAWRAQCLRRLAGPVFMPLGGCCRKKTGILADACV